MDRMVIYSQIFEDYSQIIVNLLKDSILVVGFCHLKSEKPKLVDKILFRRLFVHLVSSN